jgi:hypothetical protein
MPCCRPGRRYCFSSAAAPGSSSRLSRTSQARPALTEPSPWPVSSKGSTGLGARLLRLALGILGGEPLWRLGAPGVLEPLAELGVRNRREPHQDRRPALIVGRLEVDLRRATSSSSSFCSGGMGSTSVSGSLIRVKLLSRTLSAGVPRLVPSLSQGRASLKPRRATRFVALSIAASLIRIPFRRKRKSTSAGSPSLAHRCLIGYTSLQPEAHRLAGVFNVR